MLLLLIFDIQLIILPFLLFQLSSGTVLRTGDSLVIIGSNADFESEFGEPPVEGKHGHLGRIARIAAEGQYVPETAHADGQGLGSHIRYEMMDILCVFRRTLMNRGTILIRG